MQWTLWLSVFCIGRFHDRVICVTYVWDVLQPPLNAAEAQAALASAVPGASYPTYSQIPSTEFDCKNFDQPGFYADTEAQCQVFHRCDHSGIRTSYLCPNKTIFNQILLTCDYFYNVDCDRSATFLDFANSRLYSNQPLFDSPPTSYIAPSRETVQPAPTPQRAGNQTPLIKGSPTGATLSPIKTATTTPPNAFQSPMYGLRPTGSQETTAGRTGNGAAASLGRLSSKLPAASTDEPVQASQEDTVRHLSLCSLIPAYRSQACSGTVFGTDSFEALRLRPSSTKATETSDQTTDQTTKAGRSLLAARKGRSGLITPPTLLETTDQNSDQTTQTTAALAEVRTGRPASTTPRT